MHYPDFEGARQYSLARLAHELPATLVYHCLEHTQDVVVPAAERLAAHAGVSDDALLLLCTAAYFHDVGFVEQRVEHEAIGAGIAKTVLPQFGYAPADIAAIEGMIMATRLPQTPHTPLEELLADADLAVLGQTDFLLWNNRLRDELAAVGTVSTDAEWHKHQFQFLQRHRYWSAAAEALYGPQKQRSGALLAQLLV